MKKKKEQREKIENRRQRTKDRNQEEGSV